MPLSDVCSVSITTETAGVRQAGFGTPIILSANASFTDRVRYYEKATDLVADGFTTTDPEYLAATALLAQENKPEQFAIGRLALPPTQSYKLSLKAVTAGETYSFRVGDDDINVLAGTGTFAANDEIVSDIAAAITAAAPTGFTATTAGTPGALYCTVTATTAGNFIAVETYTPNLLTVEQNHADPGVATDLANIAAEDNTWYGIINLYNSEAMATAIAAWAESNEKLFICASCDTPIITSANSGATDLAHDLAVLNYARTAVLYHPAADQFADAAWMGWCLPLDPGTETWKFKTLVGVEATTLTPTHRVNANAKSCNYYETIAGVELTAGTPGGTTASGEYIDVTRFVDWLRARMAERVFARLANLSKIPFTDAGIAVIEAEVRGQLDEGIRRGGLAASPAPVVTVPLASAVSAANKAARTLPDVEFSATLAGAIHSVTITGIVSV